MPIVTKIEHGLALRQETIRDSEDNPTLHEYDSRGNVTASINALGERFTRTYDHADNVLTEADHLGNTTSYGYDGRGNRNRITNEVKRNQ